uniref:Uncharacterized protein n=1 Tax=Ditylenchus dipsaci TaxID=166011 RepID=A0A915DPN4_9BILA
MVVEKHNHQQGVEPRPKHHRVVEVQPQPYLPPPMGVFELPDEEEEEEEDPIAQPSVPSSKSTAAVVSFSGAGQHKSNIAAAHEFHAAFNQTSKIDKKTRQDASAAAEEQTENEQQEPLLLSSSMDGAAGGEELYSILGLRLMDMPATPQT